MKFNADYFKYLFCSAFSLLHGFKIYNAQAARSITPDASDNIYKQADAFRISSGFNINTSVSGVIALVIQAFLGLLGIIFVILIILAGYNWMTAGGNEEKVTKAKETLTRAVIGLIIVVSAYAITYFVFSNLPAAGNGSGSGIQTSQVNP